jgi:fructose-bisphosphate aldolase, class I
MVLAGGAAAAQPDVQVVAESTLLCLRRSVPVAVPGVVFLSGGQPDDLAAARLDAINRLAGPAAPWALSFSYSRALQSAAMGVWRGDPERVGEAQRVFLHRARCNSAARQGRYTSEMERRAA